MISNLTCPLGQYCGSIVWESKTKNWSAGWLPKLRHDQVALIVLLQSAYALQISAYFLAASTSGASSCSPL